MPTTPVGRFAPSPTGALHFGSLLAALASYCQIRKLGGQWRLRIDDIDGPRSVPGSADSIQRDLTAFGFEWDGNIIWQSEQLARYHAALASLVDQSVIFACQCSRKTLPPGGIYPGSCRDKVIPASTDSQCRYHVDDHALRMRMDGCVQLTDTIQGSMRFDMQTEVGDTVVWRRDALVSYSLACAVDDTNGVTHVVRGADLLSGTAAQIAIMQALGKQPPEYAHVPVAINSNGDKLSKHSQAPAIAASDPLKQLKQAWKFLGQTEFDPGSISEFWTGAFILWNTACVPANHRKLV